MGIMSNTYETFSDIFLLNQNTSHVGYEHMFRAYYQGDPSEGIFQMTMLDGTHVYLGHQGSILCDYGESYLVVANGTQHTTDWQISDSSNGWSIRAVTNDGQHLNDFFELQSSSPPQPFPNGDMVITVGYPSFFPLITKIQVIPPHQVAQALAAHHA